MARGDLMDEELALIGPLMVLSISTPNALLADKGYDSDRFRESLLMQGILLIMPAKANRKVPEHADYCRYRGRSRVESMLRNSSNSVVLPRVTTRPRYPSKSLLSHDSDRLRVESYANRA